MSNQISIADKQLLAKILYTTEHMEQKLISKKVGVSETTISKWVNEFGWKNLRKRLLVGKEEMLSNFYEQMEELNNAIRAKEPGNRFANNSEADSLVKMTASIRNLETDLAIADLVASGTKFLKDLQRNATHEQVLEFSELWAAFIQRSIKR